MEPTTPDTSGLSSVRPFASYDPASRSWRTWTAIEASGSTEWSGTWPKTGCMSDGLSYQLPAWEPPTSASDSSSASLPTNVIVSLEGMDPTEAPLLPTPAVNDMGAAYDPDQWDAWTERMKAEHNNGNGHGNSLNIEAQRFDMLPTPSVADGEGGHETLTDATVRQPSRWGKYAAAIARWEAITRPAPEPTNITEGYLKMRAKRLARKHPKPVGMRGSLKVRRQLAARFSEWMMGVPLGWITDTPGITRNEALKAAGNGVVPQQAAEALRFLLDMPTGRDIAAAAQPLDLFEALS